MQDRRIGRGDGARARRFQGVGFHFATSVALLTLVSLVTPGCASRHSGFYHRVARGENLYRIGLRYGVDARSIARANHIRDVTKLRVGQRLWIPQASAARAHVARPVPSARASAQRQARREALAAAHLSFVWPVDGATLTSGFGRRHGRPHEGVDLAARPGTSIHAAEAGKVIQSGKLGDYGKVVIIKHAGHFRSVYAHARRLLVRKGQFVERGQRIAEVGSTGNATGPHLHFEIRERETARDPMLYLH